jgi:hypothetical protein
MTAIELIDADAHVNPPPAFWDEYLPGRLKGRGPQIEVGTDAEGGKLRRGPRGRARPDRDGWG